MLTKYLSVIPTSIMIAILASGTPPLIHDEEHRKPGKPERRQTAGDTLAKQNTGMSPGRRPHAAPEHA